MKRKIGKLRNKIIVEGDKNLLKDTEIHVDDLEGGNIGNTKVEGSTNPDMYYFDGNIKVILNFNNASIDVDALSEVTLYLDDVIYEKFNTSLEGITLKFLPYAQSSNTALTINSNVMTGELAFTINKETYVIGTLEFPLDRYSPYIMDSNINTNFEHITKYSPGPSISSQGRDAKLFCKIPNNI